MKISASTRVFAVLGDPVAHSLSPQLHSAGFQAAGLDAIYVSLRPEADALPHVMQTLMRDGGGGNVTVPYKLAAAGVTAIRDERVEQLGSANVFGAASGEARIGNTDVDGILAALDRLGGSGNAWWLLGTGGSARAVVGAAVQRGARLAIRSRDRARGEAFAAWAAKLGVPAAEVSECRVVINTTPLGMNAADALPVEPRTLERGTAALDLVYVASGPTAWVRACHAAGIDAVDGREVLLAQALASWCYWFTDLTPPVEVMKAALDGRLG
ncbi:MAG: shikimate dehydrogenase family protein [Gemmatimonadales bacterium]